MNPLKLAELVALSHEAAKAQERETLRPIRDTIRSGKPVMENFVTMSDLLWPNKAKDIEAKRCTVCKFPAAEFHDSMAERLYKQSGLCQSCQIETVKK